MKYTLHLLILLLVCSLSSGCAAADSLNRQSATSVPLEAPIAAIPEPEEFRLTLTAVGDLMCHKLQYEGARTKIGYDFRQSFTDILPKLAGSDILIGNLETTFAGSEKGYSEFPIFNTPDEFADALGAAGFNIVTTANNHTLDKRFAGLSRTLDVLDGLGIQNTGSFRNETDDRILFVEKNGIRMAVMAYTYGTNGIRPDKGKEYSINMIDEALIRSDIAQAREKKADLIIVALHFGQEYQQTPNDGQKVLAAACFDEGADIVLGTHPHVVQSAVLAPVTDRFGVKKNRFVAYSLGNFISAQRTFPRAAGLISRLGILKTNGVTEVESADFIPTWTDQSLGSGGKSFRTLPIRDVLDIPENYELISQKDMFNLNRSWEYVNEAAGIDPQP